MEQKKTIYEYKNYREYLRDKFRALKESNKHFSYRYFSREAGFKSQSVLKQVIDGQSNIAPKSIEKYVRALKLGKEEAFYFKHLVLMNQAKTAEVLKHHAQELAKSKEFNALFPLSAKQIGYFQKWYYIPVRELVGLKGFREDLTWISKKLTPEISEKEARTALNDLEALGLIARDPAGHLFQCNQDVSTGDTVISDLVRDYHREMIKKSAEAIDRFDRNDRDISAVALSVSNRDIDELKAIIRRFRKELMRIAAQADDRNQLFQLNIQFFPLTAKTDGDEE